MNAKANVLNDARILGYGVLPPPEQVVADAPAVASDVVLKARRGIQAILRGEDDRLLAVVGPCSIHDPKSALEYAARLGEIAARLADDLLVVMRVYFEKPRTTIGWKGLINDPKLDGSFDINMGLALARRLLVDINALGVPCGTEFLDTTIPQYISDTVAWGAIGARTTESQIHREMVSGVSCPVGFKNGTDGNVHVAAAAILAARGSHHFLAITPQGCSAIARTLGNPDTHVILRGGTTGPNYDAKHVAAASDLLEAKGLPRPLMVDCSHANSAKDHRRQLVVAEDLAAQLRAGGADLMGVMIESHLVEGRQDHEAGKELVYGQSITDPCLGWDETAAALERLAAATAARRQAAKKA